MMKAQLKSDETTLMRSILSILIMEAEDLIETIDEKGEVAPGNVSRSA